MDNFADMHYKTLGNTGLLVSRLCLDTMTFRGGRRIFKAIGAVDQTGADELVKTSIDGGINFFDTADDYTEGESETASESDTSCHGDGLKDWTTASGGSSCCVSSDARRTGTIAAILRIEETLRALDTLVTHGKVRYIGVSNWQAWKIAKALGISEFRNLARFDTLQAYYSIAGRDLEREIVPLLESEKVGLLVWSPLAGGLLSGKFSRANQKPADSRRTDFDFPVVAKERTWKILDVMAPIAKAHGCSPARLSLAWLLAKPVVTSVIVGAKRLDQVQDNLAAVELTLTQDELRQLDEVSALAPEYPGWVLTLDGADRLDSAVTRFKQ
jgi:aryl-alcohol dehydrogenase-like predicted oxidoreductase